MADPTYECGAEIYNEWVNTGEDAAGLCRRIDLALDEARRDRQNAERRATEAGTARDALAASVAELRAEIRSALRARSCDIDADDTGHGAVACPSCRRLVAALASTDSDLARLHDAQVRADGARAIVRLAEAVYTPKTETAGDAVAGLLGWMKLIAATVDDRADALSAEAAKENDRG